MIGTIEKDVPKYADGCVKKVIHRLTGTTHKKNNCYLVCNFDLCGKHYEREFSLAKVRAGRANIAPSTDPHYAGAAAAAAAAAATTTTTPTLFSLAIDAGVADVDDTQKTPAPGQSPTVPATTNDDVLIDPAILVQGAEQATLALGMSSPPTGAAAAAAAAAASASTCLLYTSPSPRDPE